MQLGYYLEMDAHATALSLSDWGMRGWREGGRERV
jgi:hypothetical protein